MLKELRSEFVGTEMTMVAMDNEVLKDLDANSIFEYDASHWLYEEEKGSFCYGEYNFYFDVLERDGEEDLETLIRITGIEKI